METKDLIEHLHEWHENLISEMCADDVLTCDDLCGYPGPCIVIQAANLLEAQQKRIAELEAAIREQENRRWIPVTEQLPKLIPCSAGTAYSEAVNVLTSGRKVLTAIWDGTGFIADADFWDAEDEEITHWTPVLLPLPEPAKDGTR